MAENGFAKCFEAVLKLEGGLKEDPNDIDAIMNLGVGIPALQCWAGVNRFISADDIRSLTPSLVSPLYQVFWRGLHCDWMPAGIDLMCFDTGINFTVGVAARMIQKVLDLPDGPESGLVGPDTLTALAHVEPADFIGALSDLRRMSDSEPARRIRDIQDAAVTMALKRAA